MKKFSIFLPSRERPELLQECVESIIYRASNPKRLEVIVVTDDDDLSYEGFERWVMETGADYGVRQIRVKRSNWHQRDYINRAAAQCTGDYIWGLNDDCEIATDGWDLILEEHIEAFIGSHDRLVYVHMNDSTHVGERAETYGCCFPLLTRELYQRLGFFMPNEIASWGADIALYEIVKMARVAICRVPQVVVHHKCYHNATRHRDHVSERVERISKENPTILHRNTLQDYANRITS